MQADIVSIHAPAWGATLNLTNPAYLPRFQSTRPRGARHSRTNFNLKRITVSIHAPAWGATEPIHRGARSGRVSIHAPAWGATMIVADESDAFKFQSTRPRGARPMRSVRWRRIFSFNPRARVGRDSACAIKLNHRVVSIHAPAWGATSPLPSPAPSKKFQSTRPRGARPGGEYDLSYSLRFNPRARVGRDIAVLQPCNEVIGFNPRARVGRDRPTKGKPPCIQSFNPRARVGRDWDQVHDTPSGLVSIHAPAWGATQTA
ncbi:conserved hypothetical protein [Pelodictyon luteolum DSM 273]|nr:conserved hypothetical protein [Pelodictyon luteolum DSM 273]